MPSYRSINITLISQLGIKEVPEFNPPPVSNDPFSDYPIAIDEPRATTSVYVPTYPESQFWIQYSISPPHPPQALYYFKVVINDKSVVSWGCGVEDGYEGGLEKRAFAFAAEKGGRGGVGGRDTDDMIEIRVYRAKGRRGVEPDVDCYQLPASIKAYGELKWSDYYGGNIE
ncbi:uncharacterized protein KY384_000894 [Bacidia gigantensis]|uniref:uncharacterized protein n=1 Tax=Bacidia gigantensis TaxID=2732470 RepID=UPI001D041800|nr:uncharacterized protein KY384_000894 [Bacidia gigantensis]KAG8534051.1 hypothetical protein KY384_000894 [Bacidia gigantensis]